MAVRHFIAGLIALVLAVATPIQSADAFGIGKLGANFGRAGSIGRSAGPTYYVSATGSDGSDGKSPATAWQTITKVTGSTFLANAVTTVLFKGGDTFSGTLAFTTTNAPGGIAVGSYGTGQATISSGNAAEGFKATNLAGVRVNNLIFTGGGNTTNTTAGVAVINNQAGNTKLAGPLISGLTVSGYGYNGISIQGANGTSGFSNTTISSNTVTNVTGNSTDTFGTSCIMVFSKTGYGSGSSTPSHTGVTITGNTVSNCTGTAGNFNWSGSGIFTSEASNVTVGGSSANANVAHDFGANSTNNTGGATGIWAADGDNIVISYNESYNGKHGVGGFDGDGFGLNGGTTNSAIRYNYAHDNQGSNIILGQYFDGTCCSLFGGIDISWNITQNAQGGTGYGELELDITSATTGAINVHNNTFSAQLNGYVLARVSTGTITGMNVSNNIFIGANPITLPSPGTSNFYNNDYYSYGQGFNVSWNGTGYSSFAAWQTATGQEKISGSNVGLTSNPLLYVPGGGWANAGYVPANLYAYNLQAGSPMIGTGLNIQSQFGIATGATDYYGNAVTASALPVGAASADFGTFTASCTSSSTFLARVSSFTKADNANYNSLLCGLNSDGDLSHIDFLHMLAAPNSAASLLNLVSTSFSLVSHGTVTFVARQGYTSNGTTGYLDTQYTPSTAGGHMVLASGSVGAYDISGAQLDAKCVIGATNNTTTEIALFIFKTTAPAPGFFSDVNDFTGTQIATATTKGMFVGQRASGNDVLWYNGTNLKSLAVAPVALTPNSIFVLAENTAGSPTAISTDQIGLDFAGDGSVNPAALSLRANSFMMAYGINTY